MNNYDNAPEWFTTWVEEQESKIDRIEQMQQAAFTPTTSKPEQPPADNVVSDEMKLYLKGRSTSNVATTPNEGVSPMMQSYLKSKKQ